MIKTLCLFIIVIINLCYNLIYSKNFFLPLNNIYYSKYNIFNNYYKRRLNIQINNNNNNDNSDLIKLFHIIERLHNKFFNINNKEYKSFIKNFESDIKLCSNLIILENGFCNTYNINTLIEFLSTIYAEYDIIQYMINKNSGNKNIISIDKIFTYTIYIIFYKVDHKEQLDNNILDFLKKDIYLDLSEDIIKFLIRTHDLKEKLNKVSIDRLSEDKENITYYNFYIGYDYNRYYALFIYGIDKNITKYKDINYEIIVNNKQYISDKNYLTAICKYGYVSINSYNYNSYYINAENLEYNMDKYKLCNYEQMSFFFPFIFELLFGYGLGHFYARRYIHGTIKLIASIILFMIIIFLNGLLESLISNSTEFSNSLLYKKIINLNRLLYLITNFWKIIDAVLFYIYYFKDGYNIDFV